MSEYFLCAAGAMLRSQVDRCWPKRDKASDGWIGDASHQAAQSEHNPCWTCTGDSYGVVRAIDLDTNLDKDDKRAMWRLVEQLRRYCKDGKDGQRTWYIIFDGLIASETYGWRWRTYSGSDPHINHSHISFFPRGDHRDAPYHLPIFTADRRRRLRRIMDAAMDRYQSAKRRLARLRK